jgi:hypothetical protein
MYDLAKIAAKFVVELYGERLGYKPKTKHDEIMENSKKTEDRGISERGVKKLLDW